MGFITHHKIRKLQNKIPEIKDQATTLQGFHPLTVDPHLQVTSDPADQVRGRSLLAALGRHRLVRSNLQQQHFI